jgi:acetolactate synthase-1/2/3 large subunit
MTGAPVTSTLMGLGALPASSDQWLGMLGMHGTYEANWAMNKADLIIAFGSRFDDRVTGRLDAFAPNSRKDPHRYRPIVGEQECPRRSADHRRRRHCAPRNDRLLEGASAPQARPHRMVEPDQRLAPDQAASISRKRATRSCRSGRSARCGRRRKHRAPIITTEVGQHQMWAAQHFGFESPNKWLTSGGLGTMGYGLPAAIGAQLGIPMLW